MTTYKYQDGTDRLMSFGDETFVYDAMGNPTTYRGMTCTWEKGHQLKSMTSAAGTATFTYDGTGLRKSKTVGNETTSYVYENGRLLRQTGSETIDFIYGSEGVIGFKVGTDSYLYRKNLFGDVTEIYNEAGNIVGKYSYTAFGVCTVELDTNGIATKNPIRYRSYYYDDETGLLLVSTRYYDPKVGRFISPDDISIAVAAQGNMINGLNLYTYCLNNPVNLSDPSGYTPLWQWLLAGLAVAGLVIGSVFTGGLLGAAFIGAAIGGGISLVTQAIGGELSWGQFALDIGVGALTGMLGMSGISKAGATVLGGLIGGVSNIGSQLIGGASWDEINWWKVGISAVIGGVSSFLGGAGARNAKVLNSSPRVSKAIDSVKFWRDKIQVIILRQDMLKQRLQMLQIV